MRLPSAYCATSSGIAMETRRVSTQPDWPPEARMRLQPSTRGASFRGGSCAQGRPPGLAVVLVGHHPASEIYVRNKIKTCHDLGIHSESITPPDSISRSEEHTSEL